jgi:hypothetical protein
MATLIVKLVVIINSTIILLLYITSFLSFSINGLDSQNLTAIKVMLLNASKYLYLMYEFIILSRFRINIIRSVEVTFI